jgi:putative heme-binding domain-containing protein
MTRFFRSLFGTVLVGGLIVALDTGSPTVAQDKTKPKAKAAKPPVKPEYSTPAATLKVAKDFTAELLYVVPKETQGSWVNLCADPKGRLIVSDQYGALYRVTPPPLGTKGESKVEKIPVDLGMAQGLLYAFDALYVVVNGGDKSGLYRVTDTNNDDTFDKVELLRKFDGGGGEHGPHAVIPHPDGKRLTIVCGNQTKLTKLDKSLVPQVWGDDHLLPRVPDGNGFMAGVLAPGGCIYNVNPDGTNWELVSIGFRNEYDAAYNSAGDLFTFDADMEWDMNTPWYRPTRVCHVTPGSEWGWRNGAGKYPEYYADNLPPTVNVGPGSPTGVCFGYGAKFPARYQNAFFICDWSYGKLYAVHNTPSGASYKSTLEEFITGSPLPLTDVIVNPADGAMYFAIGGRKTQSALYRVTYTGKDSTAADTTKPTPTPEAVQRKGLEQYLGNTKTPDKAIAAAWPLLSSPDRVLRFTARSVVESQPVATWADMAVSETNPQAALEAILALARVGAPCPLHVFKATTSGVRPNLPLAALLRLDFTKLTPSQKLDFARVAQVCLHRAFTTTPAQLAELTGKLDPVFPTGSRFLDSELLQVAVFLQSPTAAAKGMKLLADAPTQEEQLEYVRSLRMLKAGWTPELRNEYFAWFNKAGGYKGGNSFQGFLRLIKTDAVALLTADEKVALKPVLDAKPATTSMTTATPRPFVKKWTLDELTPVVSKGLESGHRDFDKGRKLFGAANCFACHRYDNEGGNTGPDISGVAGRFNTRDLLESILDPNKEVSDQYAAVEIQTLDGKSLLGRIINHNGDGMMINTDGLNPNAITTVNKDNIDTMKLSKQSMMPTGLFDTLKEDEIVDLMAYLLSRGDRNGPFFKK